MPESQYTISAIISIASKNASFATWNSGTALNSTAVLVNDDFSYNTLNVSLSQTSTITGGQITFQGSLDGVTFFNMQGFVPPTGAGVPAVYTLVANTYAIFQFNLTGIPFFQVLLSTAITGTGAVTIGYAADSFVSSLSSTTVTGTVAVTQSTSPWIVDVTQWANVALGAPSAYGTSPGAVTVMGVNAFITNTPTVNQGTSPWVVSLASTTITGTVAVTQSTSPWVVSLASTTVTNTVAENLTQLNSVALGSPSAYGTSPGAVNVLGVNAFITNIPAVSQSGTWTVQQGTPPWIVTGNLTNNNAAPAATLIGVLPAIAETAYATVTYTTGDMVLPVTDLHGALNQDLQAVAGTALGVPQTFGTVPTGVVIGTSSDIYVAGTRARSNQTTTAAGVQDVNIVGSLGATNSVTNGTFIAITDNTTKAGVIAATTALKTDMSSVAGTATVTAAAGVQLVGIEGRAGTSLETTAGVLDHNLKNVANAAVSTSASGVQRVGIAGNSNATLDSTIGPGTAPTNMLVVGQQYNITEPAPTNTQTLALQSDQAGNQLTFPGLQFRAGAAWNSATAAGTFQYPTGTTTAGQLGGGGAVLVQLDQTTTITGGVVTFQGTFDNINWVTIPVSQVLNPNNFTQLTNPYTLVASTNQPFMLVQNGYAGIRADLSTAITGTGTVTPYWSTLAVPPITPVTISNNPSARTYVCLTLDNVAEPATEVALQTMTINRGGVVSTATQYTVTAGKTLRIQSMSFGHLSVGGVSECKARLRSAAAVAVGSGILITMAHGLISGGGNSSSFGEQSIPDGLEIAGGQQVGITLINLTGAGNGTATVTVVGYES